MVKDYLQRSRYNAFSHLQITDAFLRELRRCVFTAGGKPA